MAVRVYLFLSLTAIFRGEEPEVLPNGLHETLGAPFLLSRPFFFPLREKQDWKCSIVMRTVERVKLENLSQM